MPQSSSLGRQIRHSRATVSGFLCSLLPNTYFGWELQLGSRWESEAFSLALSELAQKLQHGCLCSGKLASPASAGLIHPSFKTHLHTFPCFQIWQVWMTAVTWCVSAGKITLANGIFPLKKKKKAAVLSQRIKCSDSSEPACAENRAFLPLGYFVSISRLLKYRSLLELSMVWLNAHIFDSRSLSC